MFARTDRLLLRPVWREDAAALHAAIADDAIVSRLPHAPWPHALDDAEAFCAADCDPQRPVMLIFQRTRAAPRLIGGIDLSGSAAEASLGYWVRRDMWGLGFATEAGRAVVDMAIEGFRIARLHAWHFDDNPASARVLRKLGFQPAGGTVARGSMARGAIAPARAYWLDGPSRLEALAA